MLVFIFFFRAMVKIALQFKANLENVTELRPDGEDFKFFFKFKVNKKDLTLLNGYQCLLLFLYSAPTVLKFRIIGSTSVRMRLILSRVAEDLPIVSSSASFVPGVIKVLSVVKII